MLSRTACRPLQQLLENCCFCMADYISLPTVANTPADSFIRLSAPAMIFGHDMVANAEILATMVDNIEVVLFYTPTQNNYPSRRDIIALAEIARLTGVSYTVHLPTTLEIASSDAERRAESVRCIIELIKLCTDIAPRHFILHIPFEPPTLVYEPGQYNKHINDQEWQTWLTRATRSLVEITAAIDRATRLLVENTNYSLCHIEPLVVKGLCHICMDVGHLLLGEENVTAEIARYHDAIKEVHLHGIIGQADHHSIAVIPQIRLVKWLQQLIDVKFSGILNLEVFTPTDLKSSLDLVNRIMK